jgi:N-acetylglucosamine kinase-like BadF-type ATPase
VQGLNAYSRMSDGRLPKGPLHTLVNEALNLANDLDLCAHVYGEAAASRGALAKLSLIVAKAAGLGDIAALDVFRRAAQELAQIAEALRRKLGYEAAEPVRLSYSGGAFSAGDVLLTPFKEALAASSPAFVLCRPLYDPHYGAALYAEKIRDLKR